jgi:ribose-phosphate pyrophosphokinase
MKVFSGTSNLPLAKAICNNLNIPLGKLHHKTFASGELYCQYLENIRGSDVFLINSITFPANNHLMQLLLMADAARRASAGRITAVIPYFGYGRQDRKDRPRVPISSKLVMDLISASGFDRILTMDLHASQIGGFTNLPFDHLTFKPSLMSKLKELNIDIDCVVSPDIGAVKRTEEYAEALKKDLAIAVKKRISDTEVEIKSFIGNVKGKRVLIVDDITESVGTLIKTAKACKEEGSIEINIAVTHGCFSNKGIEALKEAIEESCFDRLFFSNTVSYELYEMSLDEHEESVFGYENIINVDVSPVFSKAIENIHKNESISELFV